MARRLSDRVPDGRSLRVAAVQLPGRGGTLEEREAHAVGAVRAACAGGPGGKLDLVVLPEATLPGYAHVRADCGDRARALAMALATETGACVALGYLDGDGAWMGLAAPDGGWWAYRKRFPAPAEARVWRAGTVPGVAETPIGRVGLAVCADALQRATWRGLAGVDVVAVGAAWPDYRGRLDRTAAWARPGLAWLYAGSNPYRDALLGRAARALGAPVVFANASGPWEGEEGFSGGSAVWDGDGRRVATVEGDGAGAARAVVGRAEPGTPLRHPPRWAAFSAVYRWAGAAVARVGR